MEVSSPEPSIKIKELTYYYTNPYGGEKCKTPVLQDVNLNLYPGKRYLVVGGNGAGKSTLLRVLAGRHLVPDTPSGGISVQVHGRDAFRDTLLNNIRTYVSCDWGQRAVAFAGTSLALSADIGVTEMMQVLQQTYPERRDELLSVLRIDTSWRMHKLSDGQRRRVQLFLALIKPYDVIILDEVLGLLDILARQDFLAYLVKESTERSITIVMATNVFDGLTDWTTDLIYVKKGHIETSASLADIPEYQALSASVHEPLMRTVEKWLRKELDEARLTGETEAVAPAAEPSPLDEENSIKKGSAGGYANGRLCSMGI